MPEPPEVAIPILALPEIFTVAWSVTLAAVNPSMILTVLWSRAIIPPGLPPEKLNVAAL